MQLTIDHKAIKRALVWATRKRRPLPDAVLSFDQGMARVQLGPIDSEVPAAGYWPLIAHFSGNWLRAVVKTPPADGVLSITYQGGRVFAGGFSAPAELRYPLPEESFSQGANWCAAPIAKSFDRPNSHKKQFATIRKN